ncbi:MAG: hypothetical protein ACK5NB_04460 [Flavobacteriaceae bacterium]
MTQLKNIYYLLACIIGACIVSCSDDDDPVLAPEVQLSITESAVTMTMGETLAFSAQSVNNTVYQETWAVGDSVVSTTSAYKFVPETKGQYALNYTAVNEGGAYTFQYTITVNALLRPITDTSLAYVSQLLEFLPAPGQFINTTLGNTEGAEAVIGGNSSLVSLGAWGGSATYAFDHTVLNVANGNDLVVYGNPMANFAEPGVIWVMQDENANGVADDTWYEIKGSAHDLEGTIRNYSVTYFRPETAADDVPWEDNQGNSGVVATNIYHTQAYYPEWIEADSYTITGTILSSENIDMSNPRFITSAPFEYGYADNIVGGDEIDLDDAIDADGNTVILEGIDFIKVQTGIQANMGWLGELSTEVKGIADLSLL